jgi:class 3 adenylate cyclase/ketosteroid isomerase-like protein/TolB-like protein
VDPEGTFTRRVCAVLLADVSGFSALMGEDDERTARAVERLRTLVQGVVSETQGHAEPVAGDAIFATFESVVAAVDAALQIQRRLAAEDVAGRPLRIRIGVHFGDLLLREGTAFGDAINVAARLQALARPGTVCVSDGVYRHVYKRFDEKFVDLGRQQLKGISHPVHAYLIVPRGLDIHVRRPLGRVVRWVAAGAVVAAVAALGLLVVEKTRQPVEPKKAATPPVATAREAPEPPEGQQAHPVALGVMLFKPLGGGDTGGHDWMREALRDGLNTQLAELSNVKVYSKEFIDFLISREGLSEIEAATKLGIRRMLSGSFVVVGGVLRIETHVVDVGSGVLEASYSTVGQEKDFLDLQNKMVMGVIARLALPVTVEEQKALLAKKSTDVDALRMLLEAEGGGAPPAPTPPEPGSGLFRWLARHLGPVAARAKEGGAEAEILDALERYRKATEARQIDALAAVYVTFAPEQKAAQERYFENVRDLRITIDNVDIAVVGDEAVVSYTRTDDFADARTGRPMHVAVRLTKVLKRADGAWKIAGAK